MKQREETRRRRKAQGKGSTGGLKLIHVEQRRPDGSVVQVTCSDQAGVEAGCMQENLERYDQTRHPHPTPPMKPPLYQEFNNSLARDHIDELLEGSWEIPPTSDPHTRAFLQQCRSNQPSTTMNVTSELNQSFWRRNPEMKGSEPHGLHNGHYKAATFSSTVNRCDALLRNIPMKTGSSPEAWRNLMNFAIEKKAGDFRVKKMRTIQLMDAEFQASNKQAGKEAMKFAEQHHLIPPGQCGARKKHQAIDLAVSKRLVWDTLFMERRAAGWVLNDAKSCFDRVVHWVAQVALRRFGMPWEVVDFMFSTLRLATHRVRTGFGDSEAAFFPPSDKSFQGCGQGNGAGPTIWVAISSILIDTIKAKGFGCEFLSALDKCLEAAECFCFMDDTDLVQAALDPQSTALAILSKVQQALSLWSGSVRATGGAINPEKSFWWLLDYDWKSSAGKWGYKRICNLPGSVQIPDLLGRPHSLTRLEPDQAERTLGIQMSPQYNGSAQHSSLKQKAKDWATHISASSLLPYDVFPLIKSTILKSLAYPMALTHLNPTQWEKIMSPVLRAALPKARISRNFPRAVVYGPQRFQGFGIPHPAGLQLSSHLDMLLRHPANFTTTDGFLRLALQRHQLETGTSFPFFQQNYDNTGILASDTWLKRVWKDLDHHGIHVELDCPPLALHRRGDQLLTELFMNAEVAQNELLWLNWCRMHIHATTVSDIVSADGRFLLDSAWNGKRSFHTREQYIWPRTKSPSLQHWERWRRVLTETLLVSSSPPFQLREPLGRWTDDPDRWIWAYSPSKKVCYQRQGHGWIRHPRLRSRTRRDHFIQKTFRRFMRSDLPLDLVRATPTFLPRRRTPGTPRNRVRALFTIRFDPTELEHDAESDSSRSSFSEQSLRIEERWDLLSSRCTDHLGWVPEDIRIDGDEDELLESLRAGHLRIISDGSYKDGVGSAATQLTTKSRRNTIWIYCQTTGPPSDQSAYRSELMGLLAGCQVVSWMRDQLGSGFLSRARPVVQIACDGAAALTNCFSHRTLRSSQKQFDLLSAIRGIIHAVKIQFRHRHVRGHQDSRRSQASLTWWELRNIECDARAQSYRRRLVRSGRVCARHPRFFSEPCALFIDDEKCSRLDPQLIMELFTLPPLLDYWSRRGRIQFDVCSEIDWHYTGRMMANLPSGIQRWITKHSVGMCGVGKWRQRWGVDPDNQCPLCGEPEDVFHVPRCPHATATKEWSARVTHLRDWMSSQQTAPEISASICQFLASIRGPPTALSRIGRHVLSSRPTLLRSAIQSQRRVGAQCLLEGLLSSKWALLQQHHFTAIGSKKSGSLWSSHLGGQLIMLGFHMWQHRNSVQHSDSNASLKWKHRDVDWGIREQFSMGRVDLPPTVAPMLRRHCREVLALPLNDREAWLKLIRRERRLARESIHRQQTCLKRFLESATPPPSKRRRLNPSRPKRRRPSSNRPPKRPRVFLQPSMDSFLDSP